MCVSLFYQEGVDGYKLWKKDPIGSKLIIIRGVTFYKTQLKMKWKELEVKESKTKIDINQLKVDVPTNDIVYEEEA